ncbi:MAG: hypothetical protein IKR48_03425 [Kiritimatiellae bacterium]|nr:hypothetical protein [Kiritimatiellia bacterium]
MQDNMITPGRLKALQHLDQSIAWCEAELDHGYLVGEASVEEWATRARAQLPSAEYERAMQAIERTRNRIRMTLARDTRERDALLAWIAAIPKEDVRVSMYLHYAKGYSYEVIADQYFGKTIGAEAVRKMCHRCIHGEHLGKQGRPQKGSDDDQP